jgi:phosphatidylglycerophosphate synthase
LFGAAPATDVLDGYLARRWNQQSTLGSFLDPVADKLMLVSAMVTRCLSGEGEIEGGETLSVTR